MELSTAFFLGSEYDVDSAGDDLSVSDDNMAPSDIDMSDDERVTPEDDGIQGVATSDQSEAEEGGTVEAEGVETFPMTSLKENIERGKAARKQMSKKLMLKRLLLKCSFFLENFKMA